MSTITRRVSRPAPSAPASPSPLVVDVPPEQRIVIRNVDWDLYDRLSNAVGARQHVYMAFDGEDLEIMTKGFMHEHYSDLMGWLVRLVASELKVRCRAAGETTWKRPEIERGLEADNSYYFLPKKLATVVKGVAPSRTRCRTIPTPTLQSKSI